MITHQSFDASDGPREFDNGFNQVWHVVVVNCLFRF